MRHRRVVAVTAVALFSLAGCADRPNNLETYYKTPTSAPAGPVPSRAAEVAPPKPPPSKAPDQAAAAAAALLGDVDLADEGVHPAEGAKITGCIADLPAGFGREAQWQYKTGASLNQRVTVYPQGAAAVLDAVTCAGSQPALVKPDGVEAVRAWCEGSTCTVLLAKGAVLSGVQVTAGSPARALEAAKRLAPLAGAKLSAVQA